MARIVIAPLLGGAYPALHWKDDKRKAHTHAVVLDEGGEPERVLCGNAQAASVADEATWVRDGGPTCPKCAARLRRLKEKQ